MVKIYYRDNTSQKFTIVIVAFGWFRGCQNPILSKKKVVTGYFFKFFRVVNIYNLMLKVLAHNSKLSTCTTSKCN